MMMSVNFPSSSDDASASAQGRFLAVAAQARSPSASEEAGEGLPLRIHSEHVRVSLEVHESGPVGEHVVEERAEAAWRDGPEAVADHQVVRPAAGQPRA